MPYDISFSNVIIPLGESSTMQKVSPRRTSTLGMKHVYRFKNDVEFSDYFVQSLDGCFVAQSIKDEKGIVIKKAYSKEKISYSTSGDLLPEENSCYFSGTQYSILFPFGKRVRKDYSFINTNINYSLPEKEYIIADVILMNALYPKMLQKFKC